MSFVARKIDVTFKLGEGAFGESGTDTVRVSNHRVSCRISKAGGMTMSEAQIDVYGMPLERMNKLSTLGLAWTLLRKNEITIDAGDNNGAMSTVFSGTIVNAWIDFNSAPEVPFRIVARAGQFDSVKPITPTSYKGAVDVATVLSGLASKGGLQFENSGVSVQLSNPYFSGSVRDQITAAINSAGIEHIIDNNVLAIWKAGSARSSATVLVSARTGMVGYPSFTSKGIGVRGLWFPSIAYGAKIKVESDVKPANGEWVIYKLNFALDAELPNGAWFFIAEAGRPGEVVVWR